MCFGNVVRNDSVKVLSYNQLEILIYVKQSHQIFSFSVLGLRIFRAFKTIAAIRVLIQFPRFESVYADVRLSLIALNLFAGTFEDFWN